MTALALTLAALGACGYAFGARLQHRAVHTTIGDQGLGVRRQLQLVRSNRWLIGLVCIGSGTVLHAAALGLAPLSVVQPVGVLALPITVLLTAREQGVHVSDLNRNTVMAVLACTGGVAMFVFLAVGSATATMVTSDDASAAMKLVAAAVVILGLIGLLSGSKTRCVAYAAGCAVAYGLVSVLMRAVSQQVTRWDLAQVDFRAVVGIVVAVLVGGWLLQHAYASGPPDLAVACLTVIDPLMAVGLGIGLLGEADNVGTVTAVGEALCAVVACVGVFVLARYHPEDELRSGAAVKGADTTLV